MSNIAPETLQKIRDQLQAAKLVNGAVPADLYSHLTEVFNRIMQHHPSDAFEKFEEISTLVKRTHFNFADPKHDHEVNAGGSDKHADDEAMQAWITASKNLLKEVNSMVSKADREFLTKSKKFSTANFEQVTEMLEWAGISFGEEEMYKLNKSIKRLAEMSGASEINFKGKIYGTKKDYWVCVGRLPGDEEVSSGQEPRGKGVNEFVYWVTDNLLCDWIQLPDCRPEHLIAGRMIKHVMTGDLNACIDSNPPFPGKERHFLRATLSRIFHATAIVPVGLYEFDEEANDIKMAEEAPPIPCEELDKFENWANMMPIILKAGRTTHAKPSGMTDEEADEAMNKLNDEDKTEARLRPLAEHEKMPVEIDSWTARICGDVQLYNQIAPKEGTVTYAVNVLRSLRWPGAVTVAKGGKFHSLYVGYGLKRGDPSFNPTEPPEVQADPQDQNEMPEPTPLQAPQEPPEPDTDKEKEPVDDDEA